METHQKDIEENDHDPFGQDNDDGNGNEKSFLKALLAERALKNLVTYQMVYEDVDIQRLYCPLTTEIRTDPKIQWVSCWHCSKTNNS